MFNKKKNYYQMLGYKLKKGQTWSDIDLTDLKSKYLGQVQYIMQSSNYDELDADELLDKLQVAYDVLSSEEERKKYDEELEVKSKKRVKKESNVENVKETKEKEKSKKKNKGIKVETVEELDDEKEHKLSSKAKKIIGGATVGTLALVIIVTALSMNSCTKKKDNSKGSSKEKITVESSVNYIPNKTDETVTDAPTTVAIENDIDEENIDQDNINSYDLNDYSVYDNDLLTQRANDLINQLNAAGITNVSTGLPYTTEEIVTLIQYANGIYTPDRLEDIDLIHLDLLNLFISPINNDSYLYHIAYATGNDCPYDDSSAMEVQPIEFADAFTKYKGNGVYAFIQWLQNKRQEIFTSTNKKEIENIANTVGQAVADIMKGNGYTFNGLDGNQYHVTSEQLLANYSSSMLFTTEAQLIFANTSYGVKDKNWKVYNKFNSNEADIVSYDEINAWINNTCDFNWEIDEAALVEGDTFGQRVQGNLEGMAKNNYAINNQNSKKFTK